LKILNLRLKNTIFCILTFILFACLVENSVFSQSKEREYWPTNGWKSSTPEVQGMDPAKLEMAVEFIENRLPDAYSLLVVRNGYLVFEKYFRRGSPEKVSVIHSVTKSVTSALIGIALDKGYLDALDQKLIEFFPEYNTSKLDPVKKKISLKHLLTMSAGFRWDDWGSTMFLWYRSWEKLKYSIQLPLENNPGDVFNYNTSLSHMLSIILSKSTNSTTLEFANRSFFEPLCAYALGSDQGSAYALGSDQGRTPANRE
jgi:CubicO group peptidase (beta-lactamase class C family)